MSRLPLKRVQHFIPQFILRRFFATGHYRLFDKRWNKYQPNGAGKSMYKEYFYEHSDFDPNEVEDLLSVRESDYAPIIEKIVSVEKITLEEHLSLIEFRHVSYYRSNEFFGFHTYQTDRGEGASVQRLDWLRINGIYGSNDVMSDIKRSQLRAIKNVIDRTDAAFRVSSMTPVCFVYTATDHLFAVGDTGSISIGEEFEGITVIIIAPKHALVFPRTLTALEVMKKMGVPSDVSTIIHKEVGKDVVHIINTLVRERAFEYYVDPNNGDEATQ